MPRVVILETVYWGIDNDRSTEQIDRPESIDMPRRRDFLVDDSVGRGARGAAVGGDN